MTTVFKIGDRVDQMCLKCDEVRGHVATSVTKAGRITRVACPMCESSVVYRAASARASAKFGAPYDQSRTYRKGQILIHPTFGAGEVTAIIESHKMDVLFGDRIRRMVHAHS